MYNLIFCQAMKRLQDNFWHYCLEIGEIKVCRTNAIFKTATPHVLSHQCDRRKLSMTLSSRLRLQHLTVTDWWVGCYIWYSDEGTGQGRSCQPAQASPYCTKCNKHASAASVPVTVLSVALRF